MNKLEAEEGGIENAEAQLVELQRQPVDLYKILKFEGLVASGGEAKAAIGSGLVTVNRRVETQKRKKIVSGDIIEFEGIHYRMHCEQEAQPAKLATEKEPVKVIEAADLKVKQVKVTEVKVTEVKVEKIVATEKVRKKAAVQKKSTAVKKKLSRKAIDIRSPKQK